MTDTPTIAAPHDGVTVTFDLDLATIVGETHRQVGEDEYASAPMTLGDAVIERTARMLLDRIVGNAATDENRAAYRTIVDRAREVIEERVAAQLDPIIEDMVANGVVQRTDTFGAPKGDPVPLRDLIIAEARTVLDATSTAYRADRRGPRRTKIDDLVESTTERVLRGELAEHVKQVKAEMTGHLRKNTAAVLAEAIAKGVTS